MNSASEEPGGTQSVIQRDHWSASGSHGEQIEKCFREIVGLDWTAGNTNDRNICFRTPLPAEIIRQAHASSRIAFHCVDSAVSRAGTGCNNRPRFRRQPVNPLTCCNWLACHSIRAERCPIAFLLVRFVRDRALYHQDERLRFTRCRQIKALHEVVSDLWCKKWIVQIHLGNPRQIPKHDVLDAGLSGGRRGDCVSITAKTRSDP